MIRKTSQGHQVVSKSGKRVKRIGEEPSYSEITEAKDKPREYEEVE